MPFPFHQGIYSIIMILTPFKSIAWGNRFSVGTREPYILRNTFTYRPCRTNCYYEDMFSLRVYICVVNTYIKTHVLQYRHSYSVARYIPSLFSVLDVSFVLINLIIWSTDFRYQQSIIRTFSLLSSLIRQTSFC